MDSEHPARHGLIPRHNELSLFLIGASIVAGLLIDPQMRTEVGAALQGRNLTATIPVCLLFFGQGLIFTFIHLFTHSHKNAYEKFCMVFFAIFANAAAGIACGWHLVTTADLGLLLVFPLWNLASGVLLLGAVALALMGGADLDHLQEAIGEEDATPAQLLVGSLSLTAIIGICHFGIGLHWSLTFSICVAYASHFDRILKWLIARQHQQ